MDRARTFLAGAKSNGNLLGIGRRYASCLRKFVVRAALYLFSFNIWLLIPVMASAIRDYPVSAEDYELLEEAGRGVSATVRRSSFSDMLLS